MGIVLLGGVVFVVAGISVLATSMIRRMRRGDHAVTGNPYFYVGAALEMVGLALIVWCLAVQRSL